jgi:hypothetical protein
VVLTWLCALSSKWPGTGPETDLAGKDRLFNPDGCSGVLNQTSTLVLTAASILKSLGRRLSFAMKLYSIDRDGWLGVEESVLDAEQSLEWIDVMDGEFLVIDDAGFLYEPYESEQGYYGYKWRQSPTRRPEVLEVVINYSDCEKLSPKDLRICRSDCSA